jgi:hypothetical protein
MSRFLGSYKRLKKRLAKLELQHKRGDIGPALQDFCLTGIVPGDPWLKKKVLQLMAAVEGMIQTLPGPGPRPGPGEGDTPSSRNHNHQTLH